MTHETMECDVLIVGAGPAGLSAAIRLKQRSKNIHVCVLEKGAEVGAHTLSGAVIETRALDELLPDWRTRDVDFFTPVTEDQFLFLTQKSSYKLPTPPQMHNEGNMIVSLGRLCRFLAEEAMQLGVEIYPGFAGQSLLYDEEGAVSGVAIGDMGLDAAGQPTASYQPGMHLKAKYTLLAEGCRGSLTQEALKKFHLSSSPQTYGLGIKELWEVTPEHHQEGLVIHSVGWPLDSKTYGGSFLYHLKNQRIAVGFVVGLDYQNPYLNPFEEMQRFKTHPAIKKYFMGGKRIGYGGRALSEGGWQAIPKLSFPGGLLLGDSAGFMNVPKIKGTHTAMKSGIIAANIVHHALEKRCARTNEVCYQSAIKNSWIGEELYRVRNIRPAFQKGVWAGLGYAALDTYFLRGHAPWTFAHHPDHLSLKTTAAYAPIHYPKPDNILTFDRLSSVHLSNTYHAEPQPCHLILKNPKVAIDINLKLYDAPEQRYCPAGVYEIVRNAENQPYLQINAQNCIHCKTCDIKDPTQNIRWVPPEGGGGPKYGEM